jgi:hypothetical protein
MSTSRTSDPDSRSGCHKCGKEGHKRKECRAKAKAGRSNREKKRRSEESRVKRRHYAAVVNNYYYTIVAPK